MRVGLNAAGQIKDPLDRRIDHRFQVNGRHGWCCIIGDISPLCHYASLPTRSSKLR